MLSKSMIWVKVLFTIDLASGYACDCVHVVLLIGWWNTFFPFNLIGFGVDGDMFRWGMSLVLMLEASTFFVICVNYLSLVSSFSNNCFNFHLVKKEVWPYVNVDDVEFNEKLGHLIWCKLQGTTLQIKRVATYIVNSSLMFAYGICKVSMHKLHMSCNDDDNKMEMNFFLKHNLSSKWIGRSGKDQYHVPTFCCVVQGISFSW
jgi:hypothetical protein